MRSVTLGLLARAGTKIGHGLKEVVVALSGQARLRADTFETFLMTAGTHNRRVGTLRLCRDVGIGDIRSFLWAPVLKSRN
jgi:hypothetical protein